MAYVVNRAGYNLNLKDERGNNISIPINKVCNISDFVYFKYKELLHLLIPKHVPAVITKPTTDTTNRSETINMNKIQDVVQENQQPTFDSIIEIKIDPEPIRENIKPLQGVKISKKKKANFTRNGMKKKEEQKIDG